MHSCAIALLVPSAKCHPTLWPHSRAATGCDVTRSAELPHFRQGTCLPALSLHLPGWSVEHARTRPGHAHFYSRNLRANRRLGMRASAIAGNIRGLGDGDGDATLRSVLGYRVLPRRRPSSENRGSRPSAFGHPRGVAAVSAVAALHLRAHAPHAALGSVTARDGTGRRPTGQAPLGPTSHHDAASRTADGGMAPSGAGRCGVARRDAKKDRGHACVRVTRAGSRGSAPR